MSSSKELIANYTDDDIKSLSPREHLRLRPGMYIGKLGDGKEADDGIYILLKEVIDNSIDEFIMGAGKRIEIKIGDGMVSVRDYGRGIPLNSLSAAVSKMNTGGKYGSEAFQKTVGLNGVGVKAVNMLSSHFVARSVREGESNTVQFDQGIELSERREQGVKDSNGTYVEFVPDRELFGEYGYNLEYVETMVKNYTYLNTGLVIVLNGVNYSSKNGLLDLLNDNLGEEPLYPPIHLKGEDIEVAITHGTGYGESYFSFVNGQHTTQGGTHQSAFREALVRVIKEFYKKDFEPSDVRTSIVAAVSIKLLDPQFGQQTKVSLSTTMLDEKRGITVRGFILDFLKEELDNFLHKNPKIAESINKKIIESEKERKAISGVQKKARAMAKKVSLNNKKLRDCKVHFNDVKNPRREETMIFITEGNSASGSITQSRDVQTQAVFSLRGKPLNSFGLTKRIVYENEEFNLLQAALDIENGIEDLRYNKIVIATDADVDGMHIRLLLLTFFIQFFPEVIREEHLFVLETPLFRVRNKRDTIYCYNHEERRSAIAKLGVNPEITRFKGLGEISADEFKAFIGDGIKLEKVRMTKNDPINDMLEFYMGKNTPERQSFIIDNLKVEGDLAEQAI